MVTMAEENGDDEDDLEGELVEYEPTEEEKAAAEALYRLAERHPTLTLVLKIASRHARMRRLQGIEAPDVIVDECAKLLDKGLDELCEVIPFDADSNSYSLPGIVAHFQREILRGPAKKPPRGSDA